MIQQGVATRRVTLDPAVFAVAAGTLFGLLLLRNPIAFGRVVYERGDFAANSIITADAKHFELLVGNYSRLGFHHPGPAFFYVQAFGEWLLYDVLGAVPTPWNGQWVALLALNSVLLGLALAIVHSWTASRAATALCGAAGILYFAALPAMLASAWMPNLYVAPFLLLLTAAASVAAGRLAHLPPLALAAGLLIHGHVSFLLFAPIIAGGATAVSMWTGREAWREARVAVRWATVLLALFALPILLNLLLHWPGEFARYFEYNGGAPSGVTAGDVARYVLGYYAPGTLAGAATAALLFGAAGHLTSRLPAQPPRRFLATGVCTCVVATVLFVGYVARAVDNLSFTYVGQFTRAVPLLLLWIAVAAAAVSPEVRRWPALSTVWAGRTVGTWLVAGATVGALGVGSGAPALRKLPEHVPNMPEVMVALGSYTAGRVAVVDAKQEAWPALTALVVHGERLGPRVCARDPWWEFIVTADHICTPQELATGRVVRLSRVAPDGATVIAEVDEAVLTAGA